MKINGQHTIVTVIFHKTWNETKWNALKWIQMQWQTSNERDREMEGNWTRPRGANARYIYLNFKKSLKRSNIDAMWTATATLWDERYIEAKSKSEPPQSLDCRLEIGLKTRNMEKKKNENERKKSLCWCWFGGRAHARIHALTFLTHFTMKTSNSNASLSKYSTDPAALCSQYVWAVFFPLRRTNAVQVDLVTEL